MKERHNISAIKEKVDVMSTGGAVIKGPAGTKARVKFSTSTEQQFLFWSLFGFALQLWLLCCSDFATEVPRPELGLLIP